MNNPTFCPSMHHTTPQPVTEHVTSMLRYWIPEKAWDCPHVQYEEETPIGFVAPIAAVCCMDCFQSLTAQIARPSDHSPRTCSTCPRPAKTICLYPMNHAERPVLASVNACHECTTHDPGLDLSRGV